ncbi:LEA type 2 family protein [Geomonas sp. RF6]|uniref:LEA type 2 family protein n=1 Tax=Geomonas sp. RF6 TaxID=2897342 RepID=UPI001E55BC2F|nr:LEA type 2 family protein [Geomonas sp. RF6]UFS69085.1 LEA type 2 family protein [Geomonas sp. RF6]
MKKLFCLLLVLFLFTGGCTAFFKDPTVTVKDLNVVSLDGAGAGMELYLTVENKNSFDVKLQGYNYDLRVMALPVAKGGAREEISFPAKEVTDVRIPVRVAFSDMWEILKRKPDPDGVPYDLKAGLELDTPMGLMTVPVLKKGSYVVPQKYRPAFLFGKLTDFLQIGN